jgi:hypothetical protein
MARPKVNEHPVTTEQVVMIVKTYPVPSTGYGEIVCTAGISRRSGEWIRIYPYPFRLLNPKNRFQKYETIEACLQRDNRDMRPESRRLVDAQKICQLAPPIDTSQNWSERMQLIRPTIVPSVREFLDNMLSKNNQTWGSTIRPIPVASGSACFTSEFEGHDWSPKQQQNIDQSFEKIQTDLFVDPELVQNFRKLQKVPYAFRLKFCDRLGDEYTYRILDWEIAALYFKMLQQHRSEEEALEKVRFKIENQIFSTDNDVYLILGNMNHQYKQRQLAVDGFLYPKIDKKGQNPDQDDLFG